MQEACETFEYGGCAGNTNNFLTLEQCNDQCLALKGMKFEEKDERRSGNESDKYNGGFWSEVKEEEWSETLSKAASPCSLPPDRGQCKGNHAR